MYDPGANRSLRSTPVICS
jgi:hypothetical protein